MGATLVYIGLFLFSLAELAVLASIAGQSLAVIGLILTGVGSLLALFGK